MKVHFTELYSTYSIVARDPQTGWLGVAVQTHQMGVGRMVPWLEPGIGAIATQSMTNVAFGPVGLEMLRQGIAAPKVVEALVTSDEQAHRRQLAIVDAEGKVGVWTGDGCIPYAAHHMGDGYSVQANMMATDRVIPAMAAAYEATEGDLADRLLAALQAAQREGGDIRGMQSAAIKIVPAEKTAPRWMAIYDLRVDEHVDPVTELGRLVRLWGAQVLDYQANEAQQKGDLETAKAGRIAARNRAPELEEIVFWQAVNLADKQNDVSAAAELLRPVLATDARRDHWIDLLQRLQACGLIERAGAADDLISALNS